MNTDFVDFIECTRIYSNFEKDILIIPKPGQISLLNTESQGIYVLKIRINPNEILKSFPSLIKNELITITHKVK